MGQLVFQATLGGQVNLVGPNTASTFNINVPAVAGNMVTTGDTGTVTNTMLASSAYTAPGTIGSGTPNTGAFTTLTASTSMRSPIVGAGSGSNLSLQSNATTQATLDTAGNLGLGVTPSAWISSWKALEVGNGAIATAGTPDMRLYCNAYINSGATNTYKGTGNASYYVQNNGIHSWGIAPSGTAGNAISFTQAMTLDASGNLLVGNTTASSLANAGRGLIESSGSTDAAVTLKTGNTINGYMYADAGAMRVAAGGSLPLILWTNSAERARIDSSGNLLVGTTSPPTGSGKLYVQSSGSTAIVSYTNNTNINCINTAGGGSTLIYFQTASVELGSIRQSGSSAVVYNTTSDYRLKEITSGLTGYKERLSALQPKQGSWKVDGSEFRGFLAHEFAQSYPASVSGEKDAVDEDGKPKYQGMQAGSSEVIADLVALAQEQQAIITQLQADVAALKA